MLTRVEEAIRLRVERVRYGNCLLRSRRDLSLVGLRQCRDGVYRHGAVRSDAPARVEDARAFGGTPSTRLNLSAAFFSSAASRLNLASAHGLVIGIGPWLTRDSFAARQDERGAPIGPERNSNLVATPVAG